MTTPTDRRLIRLTIPRELQFKLEVVAHERGMTPATLARWLVTDFVAREFERIQVRLRRDERYRRQEAEYARKAKRASVSVAAVQAGLDRPALAAPPPPPPPPPPADDVPF
jgi:hypothetical protein